jgi:hypothetical protein
MSDERVKTYQCICQFEFSDVHQVSISIPPWQIEQDNSWPKMLLTERTATIDDYQVHLGNGCDLPVGVRQGA